MEWHSRIEWALLGKPALKYRPDKRKVCVLINPFGGAGAARRNWETAKPLLEKANVNITVIETERAMHAHDMCQSEF